MYRVFFMIAAAMFVTPSESKAGSRKHAAGGVIGSVQATIEEQGNGESAQEIHEDTVSEGAWKNVKEYFDSQSDDGIVAAALGISTDEARTLRKMAMSLRQSVQPPPQAQPPAMSMPAPINSNTYNPPPQSFLEKQVVTLQPANCIPVGDAKQR